MQMLGGNMYGGHFDPDAFSSMPAGMIDQFVPEVNKANRVVPELDLSSANVGHRDDGEVLGERRHKLQFGEQVEAHYFTQREKQEEHKKSDQALLSLTQVDCFTLTQSSKKAKNIDQLKGGNKSSKFGLNHATPQNGQPLDVQIISDNLCTRQLQHDVMVWSKYKSAESGILNHELYLFDRLNNQSINLLH